MAVALDLRDDPNKWVDHLYLLIKIICNLSVHPRYKHDVGYRLSRSGLAIAYGKQIEFQGPIVENVFYSNGSSTVNISYQILNCVIQMDLMSITIFILIFK